MSQQVVRDRELVQQFLNGSADAFEALLEQYESRVFSMARLVCRDREQAEEVMADVFVDVYRNLRSWDLEAEELDSRIYRLTITTAISRYGQDSVALQEKSTTFDSPAQRTPETEILEVTENALTQLPANYRSAFILRDVQGLSANSAAKILSSPRSQIRLHLHRARLMICRYMGRFRADGGSKNAQSPGPAVLQAWSGARSDSY